MALLADGWHIAGMDTSAAPSKSCASMVDVYQLLGVPYFGASGTVEASALLTRVFKSVNGVTQIGFSGLMLAVTEDQGLAQASLNDEFDIRALLTYSSVCGIGLDTVPVPGDSSAEQIAFQPAIEIPASFQTGSSQRTILAPNRYFFSSSGERPVGMVPAQA